MPHFCSRARHSNGLRVSRSGDEVNGSTAFWRQMEQQDLAGVLKVADVVHPGLPERLEVMAERLRLFPRGCLVLEDAQRVAGYAIAHPIRPAEPPALDTLLGALAPDATNFYMHDVALLPRMRGCGLAPLGVRRLLDVARSYDAACLIAVYGTPVYWARYGFEPSSRVHREKLAAYGEGAVFMEKRTTV